MKREITFTLQNVRTSEIWNANPIYPDDIAIAVAKESGQVFFREKLETQLTFVGADYQWIMAQAFDDEIICLTFIEDDGVFVKRWTGKFTRTDCRINEVDAIIRVTPSPRDYYDKILSIMDNEVNIKELPIASKKILMPVFNVVQLYRAGGSSITNFVGGEMWNVDVSREISNYNDLIDLKFYNTFGIITPKLAGNITAVFDTQSYLRTYQSSVTLSMIDTTSTYTLDISISENGAYSVLLSYGGAPLGQYYGSDETGWIKNGDAIVCQIIMQHSPIFSRYLSVSGGSENLDEFGQIGKNFKYVSPLTSANNHGFQISVSTYFSNNETRWGAVYDGDTPTGQYYSRQYWSGYDALPILQNYWSVRGSVWFLIHLTESTDIPYGMSFVSDCYEIGDLINAICINQNVNVSLPKNAFGSEFLYSPQPPISGWHAGFEIYFTAKSNVANINADEPATVVKCSLATVLNFLKNALNVRWYIDAGYLKIEHIAYFKNGGNYTGSPTISYDLTAMINPRNGKPWAFGQNGYSFEKIKMPEFVKWEWMDETDLFFDGTGFVCKSKFVQQGNIETINVANITTNVGYVVTHPEQISFDGFCVFLTVSDRINIGTCLKMDLSGNYNVVNPDMSMWNLQQGVLLYDAPCDKIEVSDTERDNVDAVLSKTSEATFPALNVDMLQHVKTNVGDGVIDTVNIYINNNVVKTKLMYGNE